MHLPFEAIKRKLLTRKEAASDPAYGKEPAKRSVPELLELGIVTINKPSGPSSHQVSAYTQDILGIEKAGHSGTLDPKVTGVLPVALGRGTRVVQALLPAGKEYVCVMHLHDDIDEKIVRDAFKASVGKMKQLPPVKSAVKREWREREVYYVEFIEMKGRDVLFKIGCQGGTYIRKYCSDLGTKLGPGAHMAELVRTKAGPFGVDKMVSLQDLRDAYHYYKEGNEKFIRTCIQPVEEAVAHLGKIYVFDATMESICHGRDLAVPGISSVESDISEGQLVALMSLKGELVALGESRMTSDQMVNSPKGIAVKTSKVFMKPGTYPKHVPSLQTT